MTGKQNQVNGKSGRNVRPEICAEQKLELAIAKVTKARDLTRLASDAQEQALIALSKPDQTGVSQGFNGSVKGVISEADYRREHWMGRPSRLNTDADLNAFVSARIETMTFKEIAEAVKEAFPPGRRVSLSSIHRWWQRLRA